MFAPAMPTVEPCLGLPLRDFTNSLCLMLQLFSCKFCFVTKYMIYTHLQAKLCLVFDQKFYGNHQQISRPFLAIKYMYIYIIFCCSKDI